jgi:hypothetical protein
VAVRYHQTLLPTSALTEFAGDITGRPKFDGWSIRCSNISRPRVIAVDIRFRYLGETPSKLLTTNETIIMAWISSIAPDVVRCEYSKTSRAALIQDGDCLSASLTAEKIWLPSRDDHEYVTLATILKRSAICPSFGLISLLRSS